MRVIVIGGGKVGQTIIRHLSTEGHDVAVIDTDSSVITDITDNYDVMGVVGNGASYSVQKEAGIEDANLVIAVTDSDDSLQQRDPLHQRGTGAFNDDQSGVRGGAGNRATDPRTLGNQDRDIRARAR